MEDIQFSIGDLTEFAIPAHVLRVNAPAAGLKTRLLNRMALRIIDNGRKHYEGLAQRNYQSSFDEVIVSTIRDLSAIVMNTDATEVSIAALEVMMAIATKTTNSNDQVATKLSEMRASGHEDPVVQEQILSAYVELAKNKGKPVRKPVTIKPNLRAAGNN